MNKPRGSVYAQETTDGQWIWWITNTRNHAPLARSCRSYHSMGAALRSAQAVAALGGLHIDERNCPG